MRAERGYVTIVPVDDIRKEMVCVPKKREVATTMKLHMKMIRFSHHNKRRPKFPGQTRLLDRMIDC